MSKTTTISYGDRWFWAYDEARAIWLKHVVEAAERRAAVGATGLASSVAGLGVRPSVRSSWRPMVRRVTHSLQAQPLPLDEVIRWRLVDNHPLVQRVGSWDDPIDIHPILDLAHAVVDLIEDRLDDPPAGTKWLYGARGGRQTIAMRS